MEIKLDNFSPAPSASPTDINIYNVTSSSITLSWLPVDCKNRNGNITGYSMRYGSAANQTENFSGGSTTEATITGLDAATNYSIEVAAVNSAGIGVYSAAIYNITLGIIFMHYLTLLVTFYIVNIIPFKRTKYRMSHMS